MKVLIVDRNEVRCRQVYSNLIGMCKHSLLKRGKKWSSMDVRELSLGNKLKTEKTSDVQKLLSNLGVGPNHQAMPFYEKLFNIEGDDDSNDSD
ncbi:hypothetical protein C0J52_03075 [Blattella germanica]|nr:hypothetical protein C0J52_03075 [Blattella germanica]